MSILYADGGVINKNPSPLGGTWAWVLVDDKDYTVLERNSGSVSKAEIGSNVTNNQMESKTYYSPTPHSSSFFLFLYVAQAIPPQIMITIIAVAIVIASVSLIFFLLHHFLYCPISKIKYMNFSGKP